MTEQNFDFTGVSQEETEVAGATGGSFVKTPPTPGPALFRLREIVEQGVREVTGQHAAPGKTKNAMYVVFELVTPVHAITKDDGTFVRNHDVKVYLNKSNSDKSTYMKLFNKLNYSGEVATPKGKIPSMLAFIGKGFYGAIENNVVGEKTYTNMTTGKGAAAEFTIGAPSVPAIDPVTRMPTGEYNDITVPEMAGPQRVFLWETGVSDDMYKQMWASIYKDGTYGDDNKSLNFDQDDITDPERNLAWEGSRAQALFDTAHAELEATLVPQEQPVQETPALASVPVEDVPVVETASPVAAVSPVEVPAATDPLAALGL